MTWIVGKVSRTVIPNTFPFEASNISFWRIKCMDDGWMDDLCSQLTEPLITRQRGPGQGMVGLGSLDRTMFM